MNDHFFEVRTFRGFSPTGILPSRFSSKDEAVTFANKLKRMYVGEDITVRVYEISVTDY